MIHKHIWAGIAAAAAYLLAGLVVLVVLAGVVLAQEQNCAARPVVVQHLQGKYGEGRVAVGMTSQTVVEVWANRATGSWTITETMPNGLTCLRGSGVNYSPLTETVPEGDPA